MSQLNVDNIRNRTGSDGGPNFPSGITVAVGQTAYIHGNLQIDGTETIINTETLNVSDKTVGIGSTTNASNTTADGAGIEIFASSSQVGNNKTLTWGNTANSWEFGPNDVGLKVGTGVTIYGEAGIVSATSFKGDGSLLTGIDATAIQTGNTSVQTIDTGSDGHVKMTTEGGERVRVGPAGQIGLGGANYGSSGQVITSAGSGSAASWATIPAGGNQIDLVADGAIAAGKPVIIKSNGKAEQVAETLVSRTISDGPQAGSQTALAHNNGSLAGCYTTAQEKWVTWHVNNDDSSKPWVTCWRNGGSVNNISKDEVSAFSHIGSSGLLNNNEYRPALAYDVYADKVVGIYRKPSPNNRMGAWCGTVPSSNSAITFGASPIEAHNDDSSRMDIAYDPDAQKCIAVFTADADSNYGKSVVLTTTGSGSSATISASSAVTFSNMDVDYKCLAYDTVNNHMTVFYRGTSNYIYARTGTISGTTMSWGSETTIVGSSTTAEIRAAYGNGITVLVYNRGSDIRAIAMTHNGSSFTLGSEVTVGSSAYSDDWPEISYDSGTNKFLIAKKVGSDSYNLFMVSNSGTTLSIGNPVNPGNGDQVTMRMYIANPNNGQALLVYDNHHPNHNVYGRSTLIANTQSNLETNSQNFLGFAEDAIGDGATGTIKLCGNIVGNQSGLTPASRYAVSSSGSLSVGGNQYSAGGLAVASDKLLIGWVTKS